MVKEGLKSGLIAGLLGTLCCTLPLAILVLAVFFGIGSATLGLYIGYYGDLFLVVALLFQVVWTYFYLKKRDCCNVKGVKQHWKTIGISLIVMLSVYFLVKFVVVPFLAGALLT